LLPVLSAKSQSVAGSEAAFSALTPGNGDASADGEKCRPSKDFRPHALESPGVELVNERPICHFQALPLSSRFSVELLTTS
jgi:hypothetical protein